MTKKMRVRVARIAAGAVIAAGASLTAAGAAQAVGIGVDAGTDGLSVQVALNDDAPPNPGGETPTDGPTTPTDPPNPGEPTDPPTTPTDPPTTPTDPPTTPTDPPTTPTDPPTTPTDPPTTPTDPPTTPTDPPTTTPTDPSTTAPTNPDDNDDNGAGTCTVDLDGANCVDNTDTDSVGNQPVEQSKGKDELAETGAAETTFLLLGAATMIAGGIGFRFLPRLVSGGRTVA